MKWKNEACNITHLRTTTTGLSLFVITMRDFQIINADSTTMPKFRVWNTNCVCVVCVCVCVCVRMCVCLAVALMAARYDHVFLIAIGLVQGF